MITAAMRMGPANLQQLMMAPLLCSEIQQHVCTEVLLPMGCPQPVTGQEQGRQAKTGMF